MEEHKNDFDLAFERGTSKKKMPKESKNIEEEISIEESYILYGTEKVPERKP